MHGGFSLAILDVMLPGLDGFEILRRLRKESRVPVLMEVNGVVLDPATRQATVDGQAVDLTTFEFDILEIPMRAAGRVLSRDDLMENLYSRRATPFDRSIDMHVSQTGNQAPVHQNHSQRRLPVPAVAA